MRNVQIVMLKDDKGSNDGARITNFVAGQEYTVREDLAECFLSTESAALVDANGDGKVTVTEQKKADAKGKAAKK